ncbi:MAG TPA: hypothetical protein VFZ09_42055 [Archangium sp.]|uniref:hypothetical protein n=1 Tax=Archangium sp. TaxID=1872627 RepID=UPI002E2FA0C9|nr:hypothetical protein [Archangium sp.]HEX5752863.1 hypothetical protein [Archangium sp.]
MKRSLLALLCPLLLTACSAELAVDTPPQSVAIPITSVAKAIHVEVAVDMPEETQNLDVNVKEISADLTVINPSKTFTLRSTARLSLTGTATPDAPKFYSDSTLPSYYDTAEELLPQQDFAPGSSTPVHTDSPTLRNAIGKVRIWVIVSNTVTDAGLGNPLELPLQLQLKDIVLHATVSKPFEGLEGMLGPSGL